MSFKHLGSALAPAFLVCLAHGCFNPESETPADTDPGTVGTDTDASSTGGSSSITTTITASVSESDSDPPSTTVDPATGSTSGSTGDSTGGSSSTGECVGEGCPCSEAEPCDEGLYCDGTCMPIVCGDQQIHEGEECDDGNTDDGDGCDADCTYTTLYIDVSYQSTCALIEGGRVRCWGQNDQGQLGYGFTDPVGDDEHPWEVGDVQLPDGLIQLQSGDGHSCGLLASGTEVVCWGLGSSGQLGYGNTENIGDDEFPSTVPAVQVGASVDFVTTGGSHTCVTTVAGQVLCWGAGFNGQLGYGNTNSIGDDETPAAAGNVMVGAAIVDLSAGINQTCVIQANGALRCWGNNSVGQLGYGHTTTIGDDETPASVTPLTFGEDAVQVTAGFNHTCARFASGNVRCWGGNFSGELGRGDTELIGDDELATVLMPIDLGGEGTVVSIAAGDNHTCALYDDGELRCWGNNFSGQLGLGTADNLGDDEVPAVADPVDLPGEVIQMDAGGSHTCAVLSDYRVYCWGANHWGQLGLGHVDTVGDDELPMSSEPVQVLEAL